MSKIVKIKNDHVELQITKGLDLKIPGLPSQKISEESVRMTRVGLLAQDYPGVKPAMMVKPGSKVKLGQILFRDKNYPEIVFTAPGAGIVTEINYGEKRKWLSLAIELSGNAEVAFKKFTPAALKKAKAAEIQKILLESGLWTSLRTRPFGHIAHPEKPPNAIFINAADTNPHSPDPALFLQKYSEEFLAGVSVLSRLTTGSTYVVKRKGAEIPDASGDRIIRVDVTGPHPSGNSGTHIHFLEPVGHKRHVWYAGYQDVAAIGYLFKTGKILTERMVSISGPASLNPVICMARAGAWIPDLVRGRQQPGEVRVVSGSLLSGTKAVEPMAFLGRYHTQISLIHEGRKRHLLGWLAPGSRKYSRRNVFLSALFKPDTYDFTTSTNGSRRAIIPVGVYEDVMPFDIQPTYFLRTLMTGDIEHAEELGVLEFEEEDLALSTFVSPGKEDFGVILRGMLERIVKGE